MDIRMLSSKYTVTRLKKEDIPDILVLCKANPMYYRYCPPAVCAEVIRKDMTALPPGKGPEDKYYVGFFQGSRLIAVMDLIDGYPQADIGFIGFFMMNRKMQGRGIGSAIVEEACSFLKSIGKTAVMLGYVDGNPQAESFWKKNGFRPTGAVSHEELYDVIVMRRMLQA